MTICLVCSQPDNVCSLHIFSNNSKRLHLLQSIPKHNQASFRLNIATITHLCQMRALHELSTFVTVDSVLLRSTVTERSIMLIGAHSSAFDSSSASSSCSEASPLPGISDDSSSLSSPRLNSAGIEQLVPSQNHLPRVMNYKSIWFAHAHTNHDGRADVKLRGGVLANTKFEHYWNLSTLDETTIEKLVAFEWKLIIEAWFRMHCIVLC